MKGAHHTVCARVYVHEGTHGDDAMWSARMQRLLAALQSMSTRMLLKRIEMPSIAFKESAVELLACCPQLTFESGFTAAQPVI
mmetsp:Transcript_27828/g.84941  ORF Transcript_27828/g.84941 Transcript_27828/m.84941 type:complete len:83 (-) Transcript_27828:959-1207(-)|eukprot:scaffold2408_cov28-Tisochrysis_lutea.AAC.4